MSESRESALARLAEYRRTVTADQIRDALRGPWAVADGINTAEWIVVDADERPVCSVQGNGFPSGERREILLVALSTLPDLHDQIAALSSRLQEAEERGRVEKLDDCIKCKEATTVRNDELAAEMSAHHADLAAMTQRAEKAEALLAANEGSAKNVIDDALCSSRDAWKERAETLQKQKMVVLGNGEYIICTAHEVGHSRENEVLILTADGPHPIDAVCNDFEGASISNDDPRLILRIVIAHPDAAGVLVRAVELAAAAVKGRK